MKKSIVKKSIFRKIQTAKFEQVDVNIEIEEEIEWEDVKDRMKKTNQITQVLLLDFIQTFNKVVGELRIDRQLATGTRPGDKEKNTDSSAEQFDFLGD